MVTAARTLASAIERRAVQPAVAEAKILTRGLSLWYGEKQALFDVTLGIAERQVTALIGPSGCGKSTLLKLVSGLSPVTDGELAVAGAAPDQARDCQAFIFQEATLLPWLTAQKNVEVPMRLRGLPDGDRAAKAAELLARMRLGPAAAMYPRQLSGGMKMRVPIARALSLAPKLLLLDEPFGALDEMTRQHLNEELLTLRERSPFTALFVTHSVAEAVFLSNRIVVMSANPGRLHTEIRVDAPYPRDPEWRNDPRFHALVGEASRRLREVERSVAA